VEWGIERSAFRELSDQVAKTTPMDVTRYKEPTLRRQVEQRIATLQLPSIDDYLRFVQDNPEELQVLQQSFLIAATSFFRNPDIFDALYEAMRRLIDDKPGQDTLRTEHRRLEEALALRGTALDTAANAIVITDRDGQIEWANQAFMTLSGYDQEEVIGHTLRELVSLGQQSHEFYQRIWQTITAGQVWQGEMVNRRKDGSLYYEYQTITPVRSSDGYVHHYVSIKQDITELKRIEGALRKSEQRMSLAQEAAHAGTWEWILEDNRNYWSDPLWALYGLTPDQCEPSYES
jgi:PAS domain S-box-containing protein